MTPNVKYQCHGWIRSDTSWQVYLHLHLHLHPALQMQVYQKVRCYPEHRLEYLHVLPNHQSCVLAIRYTLILTMTVMMVMNVTVLTVLIDLIDLIDLMDLMEMMMWRNKEDSLLQITPAHIGTPSSLS